MTVMITMFLDPQNMNQIPQGQTQYRRQRTGTQHLVREHQKTKNLVPLGLSFQTYFLTQALEPGMPMKLVRGPDLLKGRGILMQRVSPFLRGIGQRRRHQAGKIRPM